VACCVEDKAGTKIEKYSSAKLTICSWKLKGFPHIESFIKQEEASPRFDNLKISYEAGAYPTLVLVKEDGSEETRSVDKWKTEHLEEFFETHL